VGWNTVRQFQKAAKPGGFFFGEFFHPTQSSMPLSYRNKTIMTMSLSLCNLFFVSGVGLSGFEIGHRIRQHPYSLCKCPILYSFPCQRGDSAIALDVATVRLLF